MHRPDIARSPPVAAFRASNQRKVGAETLRHRRSVSRASAARAFVTAGTFRDAKPRHVINCIIRLLRRREPTDPTGAGIENSSDTTRV